MFFFENDKTGKSILWNFLGTLLEMPIVNIIVLFFMLWPKEAKALLYLSVDIISFTCKAYIIKDCGLKKYIRPSRWTHVFPKLVSGASLTILSAMMFETRFITSTEWRRLCFHLCWFVSVSVCLSVNNITGKCMDRFSWNFHEMFGKILGTIWKIWGWYVWPLAYRVSFYIFWMKSMPVSNIMEKRMNGFSWNF